MARAFVRSPASAVAAAFAIFAMARPPMAAPLGSAAPSVPATISAPATERIVLEARASGAQVYACRRGSDGQVQWVLEGPDATLRDQTGTVIGRHFAGPTWKLKDGSAVRGKAVAHADSPDANSVPWLLVVVTHHAGSGLLAEVTHIQRVSTQGGQPPASGCEASKLGARARSPYRADYIFYAPAAAR
ncbi:MAG TPA: DUF3455 domain-containing protein [Steroidobacteraceae bacterium]|nr:DUF3455 domain-containing protein [Steroidobacteraceae bacterium]